MHLGDHLSEVEARPCTEHYCVLDKLLACFRSIEPNIGSRDEGSVFAFRQAAVASTGGVLMQKQTGMSKAAKLNFLHVREGHHQGATF